MKHADDIKRRYEQARIDTRSGADKAVLEKMKEAYLSESEAKPETVERTFWRNIMKSQITKLAAAAVIILAVIFGIRIFIGGTSIALADVLQKVEQVQAFMYKIKTKTTGMPGGPVETIATVLISNEYGGKMDTDTNTVVNGVSQKTRQIMYMPSQENKWYMIMPEQKQYMTMEFDETIGERMKKQSNDPREFLRHIVNSKYTDIGQSVVDGVEVEGFETTDPAVMGGMMEDVKVTLWVDRKTELPVWEEMHYKMNEQMQIEQEIYDFQWDVQVNVDEFKPVIPQDYTTMFPGGYKLPSSSEEEAIDGLKFCSRLLGRYPKKIDYMNLMGEIASGFASMIKDSNNPEEELKLKERFGEILGLQGNMKEQMSKLPEAERTQKIMEITMKMMKPAQSLGMFYMTLVREGKEPVYYGDIVGPADADRVLLRWKLSDTEYRVIYGDLATETVSAEKLAELESRIPKQ
jgi:outer membrane lipoprotein-sorting protein